MRILKTLFIILSIGIFMHLYVNYFPKWAQRFQEIILNEEVVKNNETEVKQVENTKNQENKEQNQKKYNQKVEEEIEKILGTNRKKDEEEKSIIDKIKNYIKMLKSKIFQE